jgi:hypothetical protein
MDAFAGAGRKTHRDNAAGGRRDAIPDLLLKHPDTTVATYV